MDTLPLLEDPEEYQRGASNPDVSVWVAASAGTGKTKVLTDRVLRLLLRGCDPSRILCLTYTKAAAAEMANRIAERLGGWATADDAGLRQELFMLLGRKPNTAERRNARQLFTRVLDAPGGLGIRTIHAFCQSLLGRFPLEAGIAPHSAVLDEADAADLLTQARHEVMAAAERLGGPLARGLATITRHLHEGRFADLVKELAAPAHRFQEIVARHGGASAAAAAVRDALGLADGETPERLVADACADGTFDVGALRCVAGALARGSAPECERSVIVQRWLDAEPVTRAETFDAYTEVFLKKDNGSSAPTVRKNLIKKATAAAAPGALEAMRAEAERLLCLLPRRRAAVTAEATEALLILGEAILRAYRHMKNGRALLDYGDLIDGAARLLRGDGAAAWVLFKLDGGIDHLLIDEAQDTAPDQWQVVEALTEEFFAGEGARAVPRTVFAVGDVKQSIYSFQGADPGAFIAMRKHYQERVSGAGHPWRPIEMKTSFRSTRAVLEAVDATFDDEEMTRSIALEKTDVVHRAYRLRDGGSVELWPPLAPRAAERPSAWEPPPAKRIGADSPQRRLAQLIAARIEVMVTQREILESAGRAIAAGDIMVLVRRRTPFMHALVRALKERQLPVAGVDRMLLTEQLAVMDLMAIGRFALLPSDDLTLASVLTGPFVGFDDDALFTLAFGRTGSLWAALQERARTDERCATAHRWLSELLALADAVPPFEFFTRVLGRPAGDGDASGSGRRRLVGRLGREAEDPIGEFLELALAYERTQPPSLQGFLQRLDRSAVEIKRDPEDSRQNAVRVMTVHGAKGLQAPIVFLPDTCQDKTEKSRLLWPETAHGRLLLWPPFSRFREGVAAAECSRAADKQTDEYRRLLYVAMTRAGDRLIVCGWLTGKQTGGPSPGCWYARIKAGLAKKGGERGYSETEDPFLAAHAGPNGLIDCARVVRLTCPQQKGAAPGRHLADLPAPPLPDWALRAPPDEPPAPRPLRPSRPDDEEMPVLSPMADSERFVRGRLIHRLLQELPDVAAGARADVALRWLARPAHGLSPGAQSALAAEVLAVIEDPRFAPLFGPGSRAEVPLAGKIDGRPVAGQIDRLLVEADCVTVLDYKSDRPAPAAAAAAPAGYLRQMALYRTLLRRIYPRRAVRCVLLWTEAPRAMPLDDALLDRWAP